MYQMRPEEEAKKVLRRISYKQRMYSEEHGRYTDNIKALGIEKPELVHSRWPPIADHRESVRGLHRGETRRGSRRSSGALAHSPGFEDLEG